ncbi:MAG: UDP-N-acetylmuramoyl-L-alanyl-D-glutamate--2,6-diaminopimelate ligase [Candidatus Bipolaricaulia bacterium]
MMRLSALLQGASLDSNVGHSDPWIADVAQDSRSVGAGSLFVAIPGHDADGHDFVTDACNRGARALVGQRPRAALPLRPSVPYVQVPNARQSLGDLAAAFHGHPTQGLTTVAITGTKGKTSVAHLSAAALGSEETELITTITNALRRDREETTPSSLDIQRVAREARDTGSRNLVLEASAHGLAQERLRGTDVDVAVFTNLSHDHLDYFGTMERYLDAKRSLFRGLKPKATALVNRDDPSADRAIRSTDAHVLTFGLTPEADLWAEIVDERSDGTSIVAHGPTGAIPIGIRWPGRIYVRNTLAALGVGLARGLSLETLKARLERVERIEGRMERYRTSQGVSVVIDFAHSPDSLEHALRTLKPERGRLITVFGCGGDADREKRPMMGALSTRVSDFTIVTGDNPKSEDPDDILDQIESGIPARACYERIADRGDAIERAVASARPGDVVLIAGKGHERALMYKDHLVRFNDREHLVSLGVIDADGACHDGAVAGL